MIIGKVFSEFVTPTKVIFLQRVVLVCLCVAGNHKKVQTLVHRELAKICII